MEIYIQLLHPCLKTVNLEKITEGLSVDRDKEWSRDGDLGHLKTKR